MIPQLSARCEERGNDGEAVQRQVDVDIRDSVPD
jgi:hypothetical protein